MYNKNTDIGSVSGGAGMKEKLKWSKNLVLVFAVAAMAMSGCQGDSGQKEKADTVKAPVEAAKESGKEETVKGKGTENSELVKSVRGIQDLYVEQDAKKIDWTKLLTINKNVIKEVTADDSDVKLNKPGEYKLVYHITGKDDSVQDQEVKITVVDQKKAQELANSGKQVLISKNEIKKAEEKEDKKSADKKTEEKKEETQTASNKEENKKEQNSGNAASSNNAGNSQGAGNNKGQASSAGNSASGSSASGNNSSGSGSGNAGNQNNGGETTQAPAGGNNQASGGSSSGNNGNNASSGSQQAQQPSEPERQPVWHEPVYEDRWVVDQEAWDETIHEPVYEEVSRAICTGCGQDITGNIDGHLEASALSGGSCGGYRVETERVQTGTNTYTVHHEEVGHNERVMVREGYWE